MFLKIRNSWRLPATLILAAVVFLAIRNGTWDAPFGVAFSESGNFAGRQYWAYVDGHNGELIRPSLQGWYWADEAGTHRWRLTATGSAQLTLNGDIVFDDVPSDGETLREVVEVDLVEGANHFILDGVMLRDELATSIALEEPRPVIGGWRLLDRTRIYPNEPVLDGEFTPQQDRTVVRQERIAYVTLMLGIVWLLLLVVSRFDWIRARFWAAGLILTAIPRVILVVDRNARDYEFHHAIPGGDNYISFGRLSLNNLYNVVGSHWGPGNIIWMRELQRWLGPGLLEIHLTNAILGAIGALLMVDIARRLFGWRAAKASLLLIAFFPPLVLYQTSPYVAGMGTSVTALMLWLLVVTIQQTPRMSIPSLRVTLQSWLILSLGVTIAWAGFFRPSLMVFALLLPLGVWLTTRSLKTACWRTLPVAVVALIVIAPLTPLNSEFGDEGIISTNGAQTLHLGNNETSAGDHNVSVSYLSVQSRNITRQQAIINGITDDPLRAYELFLRKVGIVWAHYEDGHLLDINRSGKSVSPFFATFYQNGLFGFYVVAMLGLMGMAAADYRNGFALILPVGALLFTLATAAVEGISRLRIQLVLPLILAGAYGIVFALEQLHEMRRDWRKSGPLLRVAVFAALILLTTALFESRLPRARYYSSGDLPSGTIPQNIVFDDVIRVVGYQPIEASLPRDGAIVMGRLYYERIGEVTEDYNVGVVAVYPDEGFARPRDDWEIGHTGYPRVDARHWPAGRGMRDEFFMTLPAELGDPDVIRLGVSLYTEENGRASATGAGIIRGDGVAFLQNATLVSPRTVNPIQNVLEDRVSLPQRFGDTFALVDYYVDRLRAAPGESIHIGLDWRLDDYPKENFGVYVHLIEDDFVTLHGQIDGAPSHLGEDFPTMLWPRDVTVRDSYRLTVNPDTPPGIYNIKIGMYSYLQPLRLPAAPGDGINQDGLVIARVEVRGSD